MTWGANDALPVLRYKHNRRQTGAATTSQMVLFDPPWYPPHPKIEAQVGIAQKDDAFSNFAFKTLLAPKDESNEILPLFFFK